MEETIYNSDEEFVDKQELEVALYSQVHYDTGTGSSDSFNKVSPTVNSNRLFHIKVKTLSNKIAALKPRQPIITGDFISFSHEPNNTPKETEQEPSNKNKISSCTLEIPTQTTDKAEELSSNDLLEKLGGDKVEVNKLDSREGENKLFPFTVTRKQIVTDRITENLDRENNEAKINLLKNNVELEKFLLITNLEASTPSGKAKKKVTKIDAAVQERKPTVRMKRGPFVVKYKQDSDTDTDYSESECSSQGSPIKKPKVKGMLKETNKERNIHHNEVNASASNLDVSITGNSEDSVVEVLDSEGEISDDLTSSEEDVSLQMDHTLEFNLEGGINSLLSTSKKTADGEWKIDDQDRFKGYSIHSRYFTPSRVQCHNCRKLGHLSRDCQEAIKKKCVYCAKDDHSYQMCPNAFCYNCSSPGHKSPYCPIPEVPKNTQCTRCLVVGHNEMVCPDRWRQYHLSINKKCLNTEPKTANKLVYCYNCGGKGHFGHDCHKDRMNKFVPASYPFIAHYEFNDYMLNDYMHEREDRKRNHKGKNSPTKRKRSRDHEVFKKPKKFHGANRKLEDDQSSMFQRSRPIDIPINPRKRYDTIDDYQEDLQEDYEGHQVSNNEWWNSEDNQPARKRKNYTKDMNLGKNPHGEEVAHRFKGNYGKNYGQHSRGYCNEELNNSWEDEGRRWSQHSPNQRQFNHNKRGPAQSAAPNSYGMHQTFRAAQPNRMHMSHSKSWPKMNDNVGGFQYQHREFAMMKNICDRNQYQNW